ncbi:uncharacterized protein LOC131640961 [Vicia villosa]|uniref:uncharacterized protein LOC131640961 n=1 Tax=Vicia villosa TaxID=3911 RepID=UPI00273C242F|nr:uncharacterized protein LOC131640961 [Vicia villosa]
MNCTDVKKVQFDTHMLEKEVEDWCGNIVQRFDEEGIEVTWALFRDAFMENYFLEDVRGKKEVEFLELKQGNGTVAEYAARFQELIKYYPHYNTDNAERSKCLKFVNDSRFAELVNKSRIYDEDYRESTAQYKSGNDKKGKSSGGGALTLIRCYRCGVGGHRAFECTCAEMKWHISTKFDKPKKEQAKGKVFTLSGSKTTAEDRLIRGKCFINGTPLIDIIDTGTTHSFISLECALRLNLVLSDMRGSMIIDTPAMGSVTISYVCLNCPLSIFGRVFEIDLACLPLDQINVILGMNWLEYNHVYINYFNKTIIFDEDGVESDLFMSAKQVDESVQDGVVLFMLLETLDISDKRAIGDLPIVVIFRRYFLKM